MKRRLIEVLMLQLVLTFIGQSTAHADFEGDFAPGNWTYSETSPVAHSLDSTQMQITSANAGGGSNSASYAIDVPEHIQSISFDFSYSTSDRDSSSYDMAQYSVAGASTNLVASNIPNGGTETGTRTISDVGGKNFAILQNSSDSILGTATITITNLTSRSRNINSLHLVSAPEVVERDGIVTCTPGTYTSNFGQKAILTSIAYTLVIDGVEVSKADAGNSALPSHMFSTITSLYLGTATLDSAVFDIKTKRDFTVACRVSVTQGSIVSSAISETIKDSAKKAAEAKSVLEYEQARSTTTAANFTKDMREMRKRLAARQP